MGGWCDCGLVVCCVSSLCVWLGEVWVCVCGGVCVCVWVGLSVCVCSARHSKRGPESISYIQSEDILTKRGQNFSPRFVTMCTVLTFHNMGVGGVWTKSSLCTCQACSEVCEKMSSLWMCYTQICPRFECLNKHTVHMCVYCVLALNAGPGRCVCVCGTRWGCVV